MPKTKAEEPMEVAVILDRSGSMGSMAGETIKGFNAFAKEQGPDALLTMTQFDSHDGEVDLQKTFDRVPAATARLTSQTYRPRGMTPLLDAIGMTLRALIDRKPKGKVVVAIITDGQENSSREWDRPRIRKLIEKQQKKGWQFVFMGAGIDAYGDASAIGVAVASTYAYAATPISTQSAWKNLSTNTRWYGKNVTNSVDMPDFDTADPTYVPPTVKP